MMFICILLLLIYSGQVVLYIFEVTYITIFQQENPGNTQCSYLETQELKRHIFELKEEWLFLSL